MIVIGPKQLPEVARTLGRFLNDLKRSTESLKEEFKSQIDLDLEARRKQFDADYKKEIQLQNPTVAVHESEQHISETQNTSQDGSKEKKE